MFFGAVLDNQNKEKDPLAVATSPKNNSDFSFTAHLNVRKQN